MQNLVLIGMPGCGKSTVGQALAQRLNRPFVDADTEIERFAGKSIPEIFATEGEAGFRKLETKVLEDLGKGSGLVIATGGGCVTRLENYPLLHQNSQIFWLRRALDQLPTDGRPLSQRNDLRDLFEKRRELYKAFADHSIDNNGDLTQTLSQIATHLEEAL